MQWAKDWMSKNCVLTMLEADDKPVSKFPEITKHLADIKCEGDGKLHLGSAFCKSSMVKIFELNIFSSVRYVVAAIDSTVWTANDNVEEKLSILSSVINMSAQNCGYVQLPVVQQQTNQKTATNRVRMVEDSLQKKDIDFSRPVVLSFQKESVRAGTDKRPGAQRILLCTANKQCPWLESTVATQGVMNGLPVCSVSDLVGYDPDAKLGAASRAEQSLVLIQECFLILYLW